MSTQEIISSLAKQPQWAQELIERMADAISRGRNSYSISGSEMTAMKQVWLKANGFEYNYDKDLHEYEIQLPINEVL